MRGEDAMFYPDDQDNVGLADGLDIPYQSREPVAIAEDPSKMLLQGLEKQAAERSGELQQPLSPEGTMLKQEFTADMDRIRDMQSSGFPPQHVAEYMGQALQKFDSRWSQSFIKKEPTFDEVAERLTGVIPITGTPGHIVFRNGEAQIKEFDSQKNQPPGQGSQSAETPPQPASGLPGRLGAIAGFAGASMVGTGLDQENAQPEGPNLQADNPNMENRPSRPPLVEGQPLPQGYTPGTDIPVVRTKRDWPNVPVGSMYVDHQGNVQKKLTRDEWIERKARRDIGDAVFDSLAPLGRPTQFLKPNQKTGRFEVDYQLVNHAQHVADMKSRAAKDEADAKAKAAKDEAARKKEAKKEEWEVQDRKWKIEAQIDREAAKLKDQWEAEKEEYATKDFPATQKKWNLLRGSYEVDTTVKATQEEVNAYRRQIEEDWRNKRREELYSRFGVKPDTDSQDASPTPTSPPPSVTQSPAQQPPPLPAQPPTQPQPLFQPPKGSPAPGMTPAQQKTIVRAVEAAKNGDPQARDFLRRKGMSW